MAGNTKETGKMENNMAKEFSSVPIYRRGKDIGKTDKR
jgi:hypothetical protein